METKREDPWFVYLPNPAIAKLKMQGHITEQNNPPLINEYKARSPEVRIPTTIINAAITVASLAV